MSHHKLACLTVLPVYDGTSGIDVWILNIAYGEFMHTDVTKTHYPVVDDLVFWILVLFVFRVYSID